MYIEPTWFDLLIRGTALNISLILIVLILTIIIAKIVPKLIKNHNKEDITIITIVLCVLLFGSIAFFANGFIWNTWMEQPSVREEVVTIGAIQPRPGR
ncbi:MAG: hypothetical protein BZ136_03760 [Methanosphaera sp. rholeuAM74]|nr:MAG: hypothetical protein BZ136_03760 [Methanosphaera sp. rholeuAM74]